MNNKQRCLANFNRGHELINKIEYSIAQVRDGFSNLRATIDAIRETASPPSLGEAFKAVMDAEDALKQARAELYMYLERVFVDQSELQVLCGAPLEQWLVSENPLIRNMALEVQKKTKEEK